MKKTIFVIGAGKGLGSGVAEKFGKEGFRVVLLARSEEKLKEYAEGLLAQGIETDIQTADVTDFAGFSAVYKTLCKTFGTPDVVFYNVGITTPDEPDLDAKTLLDRYAADVAGAYNCVKTAVTDDFSAKSGALLITGGGLALQPYAGYLPLSMDKAALRAMVQALAPDLKEKGVYIGTVQVTGVIGSNEYYAPKAIAEKFWELYSGRKTNEIVY